MKKKSRFKAGLLSIALLMAITCRAQSGHTTGALFDTVKKTGFYRVILPPELVARSRPDLADLRICRPDGVFIPYVLNTDVESPLNAGYLSLPDPVIRQKDSSNKHSYISLSYSRAYRIERLSLVIRNPNLYKRRAQVMALNDSNANSVTKLPVAVISIDPYDTVFRIPAVKARYLLIDIANADNAPLVVTKVATAQSGIYMLTHLEYGREYELEAGDSLAQKPDYDLHYFTDSLKRRPLDIGLKPVYTRESSSAAGKKDSVAGDGAVVKAAVRASKNTGPVILLWLVLGLVLLLLIYISVKMVKAIAKKETNDRL